MERASSPEQSAEEQELRRRVLESEGIYERRLVAQAFNVSLEERLK